MDGLVAAKLNATQRVDLEIESGHKSRERLIMMHNMMSAPGVSVSEHSAAAYKLQSSEAPRPNLSDPRESAL